MTHKDLFVRGYIVLAAIITGCVFFVNNLPVSALGNLSSYSLISESYINSGQGGDADSGWSTNQPSMLSQDGGAVIFTSLASDLVPNDTNGKRDIFYRKATGGEIKRVSVSTNGDEANGHNMLLAISSTGRFVVYYSEATNLEGGPLGVYKTYIYDTKTGTNEQFASGVLAPRAITDDGRFVLYTKQGGLVDDRGVQINSNRVYVRDRLLNTNTRLDLPTSGGEQQAGSTGPQMDCEGGFMVYETGSTNITDNDNNGASDIILVDFRNGIKLKNLTSQFNSGSYHANISCNGRYVTFESTATNIANSTNSIIPPGGYQRHYYWYDRINDTYSLASQDSNGNLLPRDSGTNDTYVTPTDNGKVYFSSRQGASPQYNMQLYVRDMNTNTTSLVKDSSISPQFLPAWGQGKVDAQGKKLLFATNRSDLIPTDTNGHQDVIIGNLN